MKKTLYELDDNLDISGKMSIDSLDQQVLFDKDRHSRFFLTESKENDAPHADIYINVDGDLNAYFNFCEDANEEQLSKFSAYVKKRDIVDEMESRWGDITIDCPIKASSGVTTLYICFFDDNTGYASLLLRCPESKTYQDLIDDYHFIMNFFEASQKQ